MSDEKYYSLGYTPLTLDEAIKAGEEQLKRLKKLGLENKKIKELTREELDRLNKDVRENPYEH